MQLLLPCSWLWWIWIVCFLVLELAAVSKPAHSRLKICCSSGSLQDGVRGHPDCIQMGLNWMEVCQPKGFKADVELLAWTRNHSHDVEVEAMQLPDAVDELDEFGSMWALLRQTLPEGLQQKQMERVFNAIFGRGLDHPAWRLSYTHNKYHQHILAKGDIVEGGAQTALLHGRLRMIQPVAMFLWASKGADRCQVLFFMGATSFYTITGLLHQGEMALALFRGTSLRRGSSVLQSALSIARARLRGSTRGGSEVWPFGKPQSYDRALEKVLESGPKIRAAAATGNYVKVIHQNQLFLVSLHELEHLLTISSKLPKRNGLMQLPNPIRLADTVCCHRTEVIKLLLKQLRQEHPEETLHVVEIGVSLGVSSFAAMNSDSNLKYVGVDPYPHDSAVDDLVSVLPYWQLRAQKSAERIYQHFGDHGQLLKEQSHEVFKGFANRSLHLVFIDGLHDWVSVQRDLLNWEPKVKAGGYVAGHDFNADWPGVAKAVCRMRHNKPISLGADFTYWWKV